MSEEHIAYQNKDITSKYLAEYFREKSFSVYGVKVPRIIEAIPTNLPEIIANELRIDHLFLLEDGSYALVDYESTYADEDKIKYLNYIVRTLKKKLKENGMFPRIRMIVIYTADIKPGRTNPGLDIGCLQFCMEEAFLCGLDSEEMEGRIREKLDCGKPLTAEEQMQFIILPLTWEGKEQKQACIRRCFEMTKKVSDERVQLFLLSGLLVFADKVIDQDDSRRMKEWIKMTKVAKLFEEEKIAYGEQLAKEKEQEMAEKMLQNGIPADIVLRIVTVLTKEEVARLQKNRTDLNG